MIWLPELELIYVNINKNASNSLTEALRAAGHRMQSIGRRQMMATEPRTAVAMWREPHARLESAYRMYRPEAEFSDWVLNVCETETGDKHLMPQREHCSWDGRMFVSHVIPWDFDEFKRVFKTGEVQHQNRSDAMGLVWSDAAKAAFAKRYFEDIRVWNNPPRFF